MFDQSQKIPVRTALDEFGMAPNEGEVDFFRSLVAEAAHNSGQDDEGGHIHVHDIFNAAIGAGLGAGVGSIAAKTLGGLFGMPAFDRQALIGAGALGGALYAMGRIKEGSEGMDKQAILSDLLVMSVLVPYLLGSAGNPAGPKTAPQGELDTAALMNEYKRGINQLKQEQRMQVKPTPQAVRGVTI